MLEKRISCRLSCEVPNQEHSEFIKYSDELAMLEYSGTTRFAMHSLVNKHVTSQFEQIVAKYALMASLQAILHSICGLKD